MKFSAVATLPRSGCPCKSTVLNAHVRKKRISKSQFKTSLIGKKSLVGRLYSNISFDKSTKYKTM